MDPATIALIATAVSSAIQLWQSAASVSTSGTAATPDQIAQLQNDLNAATAAHLAAQAALSAVITPPPAAA